MSRKSLVATHKDYSLVDDIRSFKTLALDLNQLNRHLIGLQRLHDSFTQFNESIGALIYGLNINAWCTEFVEAPSKENFVNKYKLDQLDAKILQLKENISRLEDTPAAHSKIPKPNFSKDENTSLSLLSENSFIVNPRQDLPAELEQKSSKDEFKKPEFRTPSTSSALHTLSKSKTATKGRRQSRIPQLSNSLGPKGSRAALARQQRQRNNQDNYKR